MRGKKENTLPLVAPDLIDEPSLLPSTPPGEPGEDEQSSGEVPFENAEADVPSEEEYDTWDEQKDPFEQRHLPTSSESAPIEEADIQRAIAQVETQIISNAPAMSTLSQIGRAHV